jgi:Fe-S-cluster containining protein
VAGTLWAGAFVLQEGYDGYDRGVIRLSDEQVVTFRDAVERASARPEVRAAVKNVYLALQDAIDLRKPVCVTSGRCCRFDEFGHKLFVTTMELGTFLHELEASQAGPFRAGSSERFCPFQQTNLCSVHPIRPFGCRIFFCDATSTDWQQAQYSRFHEELKRLHQELQVRYFYVEWLQALRHLRTYPHVDTEDSL